MKNKISDTHEHYLNLKLEQFEAVYDPEYRALWCILKATPPVLTLTLLRNIRTLQDNLARFFMENPKKSPKYIIWKSNHPEVFNLGLDHTHICDLIWNKDKIGLDEYIQLCIDVLYINLIKLEIFPLITISLIRGKAYGGGLEAALSCDIIVAEKDAKCCFPEIRYNLLPSIGTLKMLLRRYPLNIIKPILFEGKQIDLPSLLNLHIIDAIVEPGEGEKYINDKIQKIHKRQFLYASLYKAELKNILVTYDELEEFKHAWVKAAFELSPSNFRRLSRLAAAQQKLSTQLQPHA